MKASVGFLVICAVAGMAIGAQAGQTHSDPSAQGDTGQQNQRPTLGPRSGPDVPLGPPTATTIDVRRLLRIRTLYIEDIDNSLSDQLIEDLGKWGRFRLVTKEKDADATLRGSCLESRHLKHVHSEIFISDHNGKSIWQDIIYQPYNPPSLQQAVTDTAKLVAAHLEQAVGTAMRQ